MLVHATTALPLLAGLLAQTLAAPSPGQANRQSVAAVQKSSDLQALSVDDGSGMQWTGNIFEGEEPITLYGTAEQIYDAIIKANPNFSGADVSDAEARITPRDILTKRNQLSCAVMATAGHYDAKNAGNYLRSLRGMCGAPNKECRRMTCQNTSASYICSEFSDGTSIFCATAADQVYWIEGTCCKNGNGVSGHSYADNRDYSVWLGYGNCGHSSSSRPSSYPYPGGSPNGLCYS
ncbi:hypothetical protein SAPIO_CDS3760 [Scedosporium apiospermum]|uniref:Secreted protein n=1 Tax=Pseudallescheria apiosperma TaxID=563466 RepID=A0A084G9M0_PSEDA|nr:uncharacterized protein SAPIO_CDS3760 [Scedosporium apiospermum]KEZ44032.1 hypothetical protein SAPIO_CDS3760 [Scedosporium apiospermum]